MQNTLDLLKDGYKFHQKRMNNAKENRNITTTKNIRDSEESDKELLNLYSDVRNLNNTEGLKMSNIFKDKQYSILEFSTEYTLFITLFRKHFEYSKYYPIVKPLSEYDNKMLIKSMFIKEPVTDLKEEVTNDLDYLFISHKNNIKSIVTKEQKLSHAIFEKLVKVEKKIFEVYSNEIKDSMRVYVELIPNLREINNRLSKVSPDQPKDEIIYVIFHNDWDKLKELLYDLERG